MKFMNMKRFGSVAMAGALALSLAAPAFATSNSVITGNYKTVKLAVTVPTTGKAVINPYGLPIQLSETKSISGKGISNAAPLSIQNRSAVPLNVNVSITGTATGGFVFETNASLGSGETGKKGVVNFEIYDAPTLTEASLQNESTLIDGFVDAVMNGTPADTVQIKGVTDTPDEKDAVIMLREANAAGELQAGGAAFFNISGTAVKKPTTAWAAEDGFSAAIAFTFDPTAKFEKSAGTLAADTNASPSGDPLTGVSSGGATIVLTSALPDSLTPVGSGDNANTVWSVDEDVAEKVTVTPNASDPLKAVVKNKAVGGLDAGTKFNITVTITDANGIPYTATVEATAA